MRHKIVQIEHIIAQEELVPTTAPEPQTGKWLFDMSKVQARFSIYEAAYKGFAMMRYVPIGLTPTTYKHNQTDVLDKSQLNRYGRW